MTDKEDAMEENYLAKWLDGELTEAEEQAFRKMPEFRTYQRIVRESGKLKAPHFDTEKALARALEARGSEDGKVVRLRLFGRWLSAAAAVVLFMAAGWWYLNSIGPTVEAGLAQHREVVLPDASEISLNAGSSLRYDEDSWEQDRRIRLEGEAFFKVAKGKTFTVETETGSVRVLGTQFNVLQREGVFIVSCYEGLVRVDRKGESVELSAGKSFRVIGASSETTDDLSGDAPGWTQDESTFASMPLSFVLDEFGRQYNLKVSSRGIDPNLSFSGSFSNTNMDLALKSISTPLEMTYEVDGNKVLFYAENAR